MMKRILKAATVGAVALILAACGSTGSSGSNRKGDANGMYRVKSGDTLVLIARANGVDYTDLMRWNNLANPNRLEVGWRLRVRNNASGSSNTPSVTKAPVYTSGGVSVAQVNTSSKAERDLSVNPVISNSITWQWPTSGAVLTRFDGGASKGIVLGGNLNDPVMAAAAGQVIYAGNGLRGYGNMVVINHSDSWSSVYANNSSLLVKQGDRVNAGQTIARMGNSDANRVQLYYEVRLNAKPIDPLKVLPIR
jgi:murein DD-endopeptidase MepM/ murein hydrolase activator NlpD